MKLQELGDVFAERDTVVVAVAQEDQDLESHGKILSSFDDPRPFGLVADLGRKHGVLDRTTAYYVDKEGVVQQIFPMIIHARPSWGAILSEVDRIQAAADKAEVR